MKRMFKGFVCPRAWWVDCAKKIRQRTREISTTRWQRMNRFLSTEKLGRCVPSGIAIIPTGWGRLPSSNGSRTVTRAKRYMKKGWNPLKDSIPLVLVWRVLLFLGGGKITGSTYSGNYIIVVIAITFGNDHNFIIKIDFGFRYTRYLS